jgi:hypothetical protein
MFAASSATSRGERLFRLGRLPGAALAVARTVSTSPVHPAGVLRVRLPAADGHGAGALRLGGLVYRAWRSRVYFFHLPLELDAPDALAESLAPRPAHHAERGPGDTVSVLPIAPQGYLAQDRRPGSFYTFFLPWQADLPGAEDRVIADIEASRVAVIFMDQDTQIWGKYRLREYAPRLHEHVVRTYRPVDNRDPRRAHVFVRATP